jgi:A-macroglobulin TED domain/MG2 domain/Alpha-2-macroglobulin family/Carboxypeptidase regulatory-like domain/Alpha-2-macroglobulin bait region domain/Macroglobulin domain MG3/A-macroglobulin receptor binding domain
MRWSWILFPFCLLFSTLFVHPSKAGPLPLRVHEAAIDCRFKERTARVSLAVENLSAELQAHIRLELLDPQDYVRASAERDEKLRPGLSNPVLDMPLEFSRLSPKERQELIWYRIRYSIESSSSTGERDTIAGVVSLSDVAPDIFTLRVMDYGIGRGATPYHARVLAAHPLSQSPVAGVRVEAELSISPDDDDEEAAEQQGQRKPLILKAAGVTDGAGYAALDFELPRKLQGREGVLKIRARRGDFLQEAESSVMFDVLPRVLITTDKPLYQPGQMLHARVLLFDATMRALAGDESTLSITDPEGTTLFRAPLKTSQFGVASADWPIPENARLGPYEININRAGQPVSSYQFKISRYDLPNFTVRVEPDRPFYLPGQDAAVSVQADYLFGRPVTKGRVRVVRETEREWDYREQRWKTEEAETYEGETDARGRFTAHVKLGEEQEELADSDYRRFRDLTYAAYFTDLSTNRTEERRFDLRITKEPIHVYLIQGDGPQNALYPMSFYLSTFYADGSPAQCSVTISEELPEPGGPRGATAHRQLRTLRTNSYGLAKIDELPIARREEEEPEITFRLVARDGRGRVGHKEESIWTKTGEVVSVRTDKTLYRAGEDIHATITSSLAAATLFVDVVQDWRVLRSRTVQLRDGRASVTLPYGADFKDRLSIIAYPDRADPYRSNGAHTVLYPRERRLKLDVQASQESYRPGEEAQVEFRVSAGAGGPARMSALGVVVFDKAVEERMRTDEEAGGSGYGRRYNTTVEDLLGEREELAGVTLKDLYALNLAQGVSEEMELVAEVMLNQNGSYYPRAFSGEDFESDAGTVFAGLIRSQLATAKLALAVRYAASSEYPTDARSFQDILKRAGISFDSLRDPWAQAFRARFFLSEASDWLEVTSAGMDKRFGTSDDMVGLRESWPYFRPTGEKINRAMRDYHVRTGRFIRDARTLREELARSGFELNSLLDRWGRPYSFAFEVDDSNFVLRVMSGGPDGRFTSPPQGRRSTAGRTVAHSGDDFTIWTNRMDYFAQTQARINRALLKFLEETRRIPKSEAELAQALEKSGIDKASLQDPWGRRYYAVFKTQPRYSDRMSLQSTARYGEAGGQRTVITPVTETLYRVMIRSSGPDGRQGTVDDFTLGEFSRVISEQAARGQRPNHSRRESFSASASGALGGVVTDPNGAVVPGASVEATHQRTLQVFDTKTDTDGRYLLGNLPAGFYTVTFDAANFKRLTITDVAVNDSGMTDLPVLLQAGAVSETVNVMSDAPQLQTTSSALSKKEEMTKAKEAALRAQVSTPRLREYFPETLVWQPSIETDEEGRASLRFKLADNITTWKLAVIGSTADGELGTAEREIRSFQPFFVEHDPPRVLTEGDRIELPVVLRNYLDRGLAVDLEIKPEDWFSLSGPAHKRASVASNDATRETFGFRATSSIKEGRQRIIAISPEAGDQVEKSVSVHPDGEERAQTLSQILKESAALEWVFPAETIKGTGRAEVKIYPNLLAHVMESVEAIMQRPYGCAEQTISSSYPSLMVLSRDKQGGTMSPLAKKALRYVAAGYERLLNYQMEDGGFSYWGRGQSDLALTAYALRFLSDAADFVAVDEEVIEKARKWLVSRQRPDGSWHAPGLSREKEDVRQTAILTSYVARVVAALPRTEEDGSKETGATNQPSQASGPPQASKDALSRALDYLTPRVKEMDEPYLIASYTLASLDTKQKAQTARAREAIERLRGLAKSEAGGSYWALETNTPFYGWGLAGRIETTALAVQALSRSSELSEPSKPAADDSRLVDQGLLFLLRQKDRYGVWYSTQATVNVLDAMIALLATSERGGQAAGGQAEVIVNGEHAASLMLPGAGQPDAPLTVDVSKFLTAGRNLIEIKRGAQAPQASVQVVSTYYVPWQARAAAATIATRNASAGEQQSDALLRLAVGFDRAEVKVGDEVTCSVAAERVGFRGYGMMLAEVGLPPGADVDRASLERAMKESDWALGQYDLLPDRVVFYLWPQAGGTRFQFKFRPRFGMQARTAPSLIYDYYNPEARTVLAPTDFVAR